jgi:hypothetical protein
MTEETVFVSPKTIFQTYQRFYMGRGLQIIATANPNIRFDKQTFARSMSA